jgi:isopenicillin-N N-acyltransferase-like protein
MVCHTNHFVANTHMREGPWLSGSPVRLARVRELAVGMDERGKSVSGEALRGQVFSDGWNAPQAISAVEDLGAEAHRRWETLFCIVMWFGQGGPRGEVVWGRPGSGEEGPVLHIPW